MKQTMRTVLFAMNMLRLAAITDCCAMKETFVACIRRVFWAYRFTEVYFSAQLSVVHPPGTVRVLCLTGGENLARLLRLFLSENFTYAGESNVEETQRRSGPDSEGKPVTVRPAETRGETDRVATRRRAGLPARSQAPTGQLRHRRGTLDRATGWKTGAKSLTRTAAKRHSLCRNPFFEETDHGKYNEG
jgi:hypothetical protein